MAVRNMTTNAKCYLNYTIDPSTLTQGKWNYTLVLQDKSNNFGVSTIWVDITGSDSLAPEISDAPTSSGLLGRGQSLTIGATDLFPDKYEFLINSDLVDSGFWQSGVTFVYELDALGLNVGNNDLEFIYYDLAGHVLSYPWSFSLLDIDPPTLVEFPFDFMVYDHNLTVTALPHWSIVDHDPQPGTYEIYKIWDSNTELVKSGSWVPGNASFTIPVIDPLPGQYTFEARFYDASGNLYVSSVDVTVLDIISPYILDSPNIHFEPLFSPDWFEFIVSEKYPDTYTLYRNNSSVDEGNLASDFPIVFERFEDLPTGVYNYTLYVTDESGNVGVGNLLVLIIDYTPPLIKRPADITYSEGSTGNIIVWEIREAYPFNYSIYQNDVLIDSGSLTTSVLSLSVDGLSVGVYKYTLIVFDEDYQSHTCVSYVNVIDVTPPAIQHIGDLVFTVGDEDAAVIWKVSDTNPSTYSITANGTEVESSKPWDGSDIIFRVTGYAIGVYEIQLTVTDTAGNTASSSLYVKVVAEQKFTPATPGFTLISALGLIILCYSRFNRKKKRK